MKQETFPRGQTVIGVTLVSVVLLSALALGANRPVSWSLLAIAVSLIFVFQVAFALFGRMPFAVQRLRMPGLLFLAAVLWAVVQNTPGLMPGLAHPVWRNVPEAVPAISADPGQGRHAVMRLLCYGMVFVMTVWTCASSERAGTVLRMIALFSGGLAAYGLYVFGTGSNPILGEMTNRAVVQASFVNRNSYATYAGFGALANTAAYLLALRGTDERLARRLERFFSGAWVFALGALLCLGALSLTQSRAGTGATVIGFVVFVLAWRRQRDERGLVLPGVLLALLVFIGATSATGLLERFVATDGTDGRFAAYPAILQAILDRPLLGHGLGAFHEGFRAYIPPQAAMGEWVRAHSTYLELGFGLGLPAAAIYLLAQVLIARQIWRGTVIRARDRVFSCFALGCVSLAAFHALFDFSLQMPATAALFAVILGMGFAQSFGREQTAQDRGRAPRHRKRPS